MTANARDEKWSEWITWHGATWCPVEHGAEIEYRMRTNGGSRTNIPENLRWEQVEALSDIIAYRYKIKEPESDMHPDLEWLARNTGHKQFGQISVRRNADFHSGYQWSDLRQTGEGWYHHSKVEQARKDLGLIMSDEEEEIEAPEWSGYVDADDDTDKLERLANYWSEAVQTLGIREVLRAINQGVEGAGDVRVNFEKDEDKEDLKLCRERMNEESVKVSIDELCDNVNKPKHYQLREGYEVYDLRQDLAAKAANGGATYDQYSDWDRAIEYIIRMWGKNRLEDAKKGRWYLDKLIGKLEAESD